MAPALSAADYPAYAENISNKTQPPLRWGKRPAVIVLDVGKSYFSVSSPISLLESSCGTAAAIPETVAILVAAARAGGCPVIWVNTLFTNTNLRDAGLWKQKMSGDILGVFNEKDEARQHVGFLDGLLPQLQTKKDDTTSAANSTVPDLVVTKKFASAFFGTNLVTQLQVIDVDTLVFCGAKTGGEIRQSVLDAQGLGFRGIVSPPKQKQIALEGYH